MNDMKNIFLENITLKNGINFILSKASLDDASQIIKFLNEAGGETDFLTFGLNDFSLSVKEEENIIRECLELDNELMLVGKIDNKIIAQLFLQRSSKSRISHIGEIGISVCKDFWNNSIAFHMISASIAWARGKNITKIQLQVRADNEKAINLYRKMGFCMEGEVVNAIKINNRYYDDYRMYLLL